MAELVNRYSEFAVNMPGLYMCISSSDNMRIDPDATWNSIPVMMSEMFQHGNTVNVHLYTCFNSFTDLFKGNAIRCEQNFRSRKSRIQSQLHLMYGNSIQARTLFSQKLQDIRIVE